MTLKVSHHLLLCASPKKALCCTSDKGLKSWEKLKQVLHELNLENPSRPEGVVLRSKVDCLRVCTNGPILLIWPDGIWYKNVSPQLIEEIVKKHLLKGIPLSKYILKQTPLQNFA